MTDRGQLAEIKARRAAISPAPWKRGDEWTSNLVSDAEGEIVVYDEGRPGEDDADFITHAPADIDWLVGEVERLLEQEALALKLGDLLPKVFLERDRLRGLLARLEWAGTNPRNPVNPHCPVCGGWPAQGHGLDSDGQPCWLAAELLR